MHNKLFRIGCLTALIILFAAMPAWAVMFGFDNITNNDPDDAAAGEAQLSVEVTKTDDGDVQFTFSNTGDVALYISNVYFDDNGFLGESEFIESEGVEFKEDKDPKELPGGEESGFVTDYSFKKKDGVDRGEKFIIVFDLLGDFGDLLAALGDGTFRIGIQTKGSKESFTNDAPVPEPATLLLFGTGLVGLAGLGRRRLLKK